MTLRPVAWLAPATAILAASPAGAQTVAIDLPAGPLGLSIDALARETGSNVVLGDPDLWRRPVAAVRGRMTVAAAISLLARQAGAAVRRVGAAGWRLTALPPRPAKAPRRARPAPIDGTTERYEDVVVQASKRGVATGALAGSVEIVTAPRVGIEGGTEALVTRSTIFSSTYRGAGREKLFVRGVADSSFAGRVQSPTGSYLGDVRLTYGATDPDLQLYDLASVEVLQGPQGTLYGTGALGGIIRLNPIMPQRDRFGGSLTLGGSVTAHGAPGADGDAVVNLPLTERLAVRAVGYARSDGGYIDKPTLGNDVNRTRIFGGRVIARWWPASHWTVDATLLGQRIRSRDNQYVTIGSAPLESAVAQAEPYVSGYWSGQMVVNGRLGAVDLVSATGRSRQTSNERMAAPEVWTVGRKAYYADVRQRNDLITHEMRLSRRTDNDAGWVVGLAYADSGLKSASYDSRIPQAPLLSVADRTSEIALFGEASIALTRLVTLGVGARAVQTRSSTQQLSSVVPALNGGRSRRTQRWVLPAASLLVRPTASIVAYVRHQQGRRPNANDGPAELAAFGVDVPDERISSIEGGVRWTGDRGQRVKVSLQRTRWRGIQIDFLDGFYGVTRGYANDRAISSLHMVLEWPLTKALKVEGAATFNRSRPTDGAPPDLVGKSPDVAGAIVRAGARWTQAIGGDARFDLDGWARYEGASPAVFGSFAFASQGDYLRTGLTASYTRRANSVSVAIDNALDARGTRFLLGSLVRAGETTTPLRPFTARIGNRRDF